MIPLRWITRAIAWIVVGSIGLSTASAFVSRPCASQQPIVGMRGEPVAALVLSAGLSSAGEADWASKKRVDAAYTLWQNGIVSELVMTGGAVNGARAGAVADHMVDYAVSLGLPAAALSAEPASLSTLQNALYSKPLLDDASAVVLVTSGFHLWRARASMVWAGQPIAAQCRAGRFDQWFWYDTPLMLAYEGLKWPANAARAVLWSVAGALGKRDWFPDYMLA